MLVAAPSPSDQGSSLIEAMIALALCAAVLASACPVLLALVRSSSAVRNQSMTALLAVSKLEQLRALDWYVSEDASGALVEVVDTSTDLSQQEPSSGGPGLRAGTLSTLRANVAGYVDYLDADGRWLGAGESVPARTRYVRRWAVAPVPYHGRGVLAVHAAVFAWTPAASRPPLDPRSALTWLSSAKAREWR